MSCLGHLSRKTVGSSAHPSLSPLVVPFRTSLGPSISAISEEVLGRMLSLGLDPDLEQVLERDVDDLARYNIVRYLHGRPWERGSVSHFSEQLGLRSLERTQEALDGLVRCGLLTKSWSHETGEEEFGLSEDPAMRLLADRLCSLDRSPFYGDIVERLAARSLRRARKAQQAAEAARRGTG